MVARKLWLSLLLTLPAFAAEPPGPPAPAQVRREMGIPSTRHQRGQKDTVGYACTAAQMAAVVRAAEASALPRSLGPAPSGPAEAVLCPHDDYLYAAPCYRAALAPLRARTVVLVGVFHQAKRFGMRDRLVFEDYRSWRTPDGPLALSPLREALCRALGNEAAVVDDAAHDSEHSLEGIAYWLKHRDPRVEVVPVLVPLMDRARLEALSVRFADALAALCRQRGLLPGRDIALVLSSDGVHYGADFDYTPYGPGGLDACVRAMAADEAILKEILCGASPPDARRAYEAFQDPLDPAKRKVTWCGRFSVPFGLAASSRLHAALSPPGTPLLTGYPIGYGCSVAQPLLKVEATGLGTTAPSNLYHFVGYPAAVYTVK